MSRVNKRKHVLREMFEDGYNLPLPDQEIVEVNEICGNFLYKVRNGSDESYLMSMPNKFRNCFFIKRGMYVLVEPIAEGKKVKSEMVRVLTKEHIQHFKDNNCWPNLFQNDEPEKDTEGNTEDFVNTNRGAPTAYPSDSSSDSEQSSESSDTDN